MPKTPTYENVAEYIKRCKWLVEEAEEIRRGDVEGYEDGLRSVWNVLDIQREEGLADPDLMNRLEDNIRTLAKADLIQQLMKEIALTEKAAKED